MAAKTYTLIVESEQNFICHGIVSSVHLSRLAWEINQELHLNLARGNNLELFRKNRKSHFAYCHYDNFDLQIHVSLLKNKGSEGYIFNDLRQFDYFLIEKQIDANQGINTIPIQKSKIVQFCSLVNVDALQIEELQLFE